jgi:hypothetical protein
MRKTETVSDGHKSFLLSNKPQVGAVHHMPLPPAFSTTPPTARDYVLCLLLKNSCFVAQLSAVFSTFELCNVLDLVTFLRHRTRSCEEDRILATKGRFKDLLLPGACSFEDLDKVLEERRAILFEVRGRER